MKSTYEDYIVQRAIDAAKYIIENKSTIRETANYIGTSKSTVHKDLKERLPKINYSLYKRANEIIELNKEERYLRGGLATRKLHEKQRENNEQN